MYGIQFGAHAICDTHSPLNQVAKLTSKCQTNSNPKIRHASLGTKPNTAANLHSKLNSLKIFMIFPSGRTVSAVNR